MPYKRQYNQKRSRPGYKACGKMVYGDAKKALAIARGVRSLINVEYKFLDNNAIGATISSTPVVIDLPIMAQGDTANTREGNSIKLTKCILNGNIFMNASATASVVRLMLVWDAQSNGAAPPIAGILQDSTAGDNMVSPYNPPFKKRFFVLWDKTFNLSDSGNKVLSYHKVVSLNHHVRYLGNAGTVADLTSGNLVFIHISNEGTNTPTLAHWERIRFLDN